MMDMRDVGVPQEVADKLTIVESVNRLNYTQLREMVANQDKRIKYIVQKDGTRLDMATIKAEQTYKSDAPLKEHSETVTSFYSIDNRRFTGCLSCAIESKFSKGKRLDSI